MNTKTRILPEWIYSSIWPGATVKTELLLLSSVKRHASKEYTEGKPSLFIWDDPKLEKIRGPWVVVRMELTHPDSPITLTYTYNQDKRKADITAEGLYQASNRDIQKVLPVIDRLRAGMDLAKPSKAIYDRYYERLELGGDYNELKEEFLATTAGSSEAFNAAMYRRRKQKANDEK